MCGDSYTEHVQILSQSSLNGYKRLFGGRLMEWIDVVAGVVARRHSNRNVTTAAVDNLRFEGPAYGNETIVLCGYITYTGRTSMEVCVRTYVEELNGHKRLINVAYLVMVAWTKTSARWRCPVWCWPPRRSAGNGKPPWSAPACGKSAGGWKRKREIY